VDTGFARLDPIIAVALSSAEPFEWGLELGPTRLSRMQQQLMDEAAYFGIHCGFTVPIHDGRSPVAAVTFAADGRQASALRRHVEAHGRVLQLMAMYFHDFIGELAEMHRLRCRVFKERLGWDVQVSGDMEIDEFDALHPAYLLQRANDGHIQGCVRLLPSSGANMLRHAFPILLDGASAPASPTIWESSRFALDIHPDAPKAAHGVATATYELFAGLIEFGLWRQLTDVVTVTDVRMERILRRVGWPLRRIGQPRALGNTLAVAGFVEISAESLTCIRSAGGLQGPVLWAPVALAAA
jgi:N-acyl-L-homoserine lactone synthetase